MRTESWRLATEIDAIGIRRTGSFANGGGEGLVSAAAAAHVDAKALDFLIECGERDHEALGGFGLVPSGALEHVDDDAALDLVHDLKERRQRVISAGARARLAGQRRKKFGKLQADATDDFLAANILGEQVDVDAFLRGQHYRAFDNIFELADVAGPIVIHQEFQCGGSEVAQRLVVFLTVAIKETRKQRGNVFAAIAQRRQLKMNDVEAVIEIFPEAPFADKGEEVHVGGSDDADVDFNLLGAAEAHEFALLNNAEELGLRFRTDGGDFVEEDGALIGDLEKTLLGSDSACESAFDVAEKLRLQEIYRNGAGIDGDKRLVRARRGGVNGFGDELFASAAFATDQNCGARWGDL